MKHKTRMLLYWLILAVVIYFFSFFIRIPEGYFSTDEERLFDRQYIERTHGQ